MNTIQDVVMTLANDVRLHGVAVATIVNAIHDVCNNTGVQLIAGHNYITYRNDDWLVTDEYHFVINGKHIIVGCPFYVSATDDINMFNKHLVVCSDSKRFVCVNHIAGMDTIYRD